MNGTLAFTNLFQQITISWIVLLITVLPVAATPESPDSEGWLYQVPMSLSDSSSLSDLSWNEQLLNPFDYMEEDKAELKDPKQLYCSEDEQAHSEEASPATCKGVKHQPVISSMLKQAKKFIGTPYRYGGQTPKGFDCSGFVLYNLKRIGVTVPRTAHRQYLLSTPVAETDLKAGDLVFFRSRRSSRNITHVGIFLGEGKRFIHAASRRSDVMISSLDNPYWRARFVRGGRLKLV